MSTGGFGANVQPGGAEPAGINFARSSDRPICVSRAC
jgi:hypothetical protein